ncbi:MAG: T9SS type A sorting domain-containing protein [Bacteroidia bacterium]|nr:T9SS type A sorting domain-containing protein [Bacteroidia bacterium]
MKKIIIILIIVIELFLLIAEINNIQAQESRQGEKGIFTISCTSTNETCFMSCNGSITVNLASGVPTWPVTITIYTPVVCGGGSVVYGPFMSLPQTITEICSCNQSYNVKVTDSDTTNLFANITVLAPPQLLSYIIKTNPACFGGNDGSADLNPSGGTPPLSFLWSNGATSEDLNNIPAGNYNVTITDNNGCTHIDYTDIYDPAPSYFSQSHFNATCGNSDGMATAGPVAKSQQVYTYLWSNGATTDTIWNIPAGIYHVTITDSSGCSDVITADVSEDTGPSVYILSLSDVSCFAMCNGEVQLQASGGAPPYSYIWSDGATNDSRSSLCPGKYFATVTDSLLCIGVITVEIHEPESLSVSFYVDEPECYNINNGAITAIPVGGSCPYYYQWNNGDTSASLSGLSPGTYAVIITDINNCTAVDSVQITAPPLLMAIIMATNVTCYSGNDGSATVAASGGTPPYTYLWNTGASTDALQGVSAGIYYFTITDAHGCNLAENISVSEPAQLEAIITSSTDVSCNGGNNGTAIVTAYGGISPYSFLWPSLNTTSVETNLFAGSYVVTVTDYNGCTATAIAVINEPEPVSVTKNIINVSCFGGSNGSIDITATGGAPGYNYLWSTSATTQDIISLASASYSLTITDSLLCTAIDSFLITQPDRLEIIVDTIVNASCNGYFNGTIDIAAAGGTSPYSYNWSNGHTSASLSGLSAGSYYLTITDNNGCYYDTSFTVTQPAILEAAASATDVTCYGYCDGQGFVSVTGGTFPYTYIWDAATGNQTTQTAVNLCSGAYNITVNDANGCISDTVAIVNQPSEITLTPASTTASCGIADGTASVTATGGNGSYSYDWSPDGFSGNGTNIYSNLPGGIYSVIITDITGCSSGININVNETGAPSLTISTVTHVTCNGFSDGEIITSANGGTLPYSYLWSTGDTSSNLINQPAGSYNVTLTDGSGCNAFENAVINQPPSLTGTIAFQSDVTCNNGINGILTVMPEGGTPPYTYLWNDPAPAQTNMTATMLSAGNYIVTITDNNNCAVSVPAAINEPTAINITGIVTPVTCFNGNDGAINTTTAGGTPGYTYLWNTGASTDGLQGVSAGIYYITVTDANLCTKIDTNIVNEPAAMSVLFTYNNVYCYGSCDGNASITVINGQEPYDFIWSSGETTSLILSKCSGMYYVTLTDINGCSTTDSINITEPQEIILSVTGTDITCYGAADGMVTANVSGGTSPYNYNWNMGCTDIACNVPTAGISYITVTDNNGCTITDSVIIYEPPPLDITFSVNNESCHLLCDGVIDITVTGGTPPCSYLWNDLFTLEDRTNLCSGSYYITITDSFGCIIDTVATINPGIQIISDAGPDQNICENNTLITLNGYIANAMGGIWSSSGTGSFGNSALLNTIYTPSSDDLTAGSVIFTLTSAGNGTCSSVTDTLNIIFIPAPVADAGADVTLCANNADIILTGSISFAAGGQWISSGNGIFSNPFELSTVYSPSPAEIASGSTDIILITTGNGNCNAVSDTLNATFTQAPGVSAGPDQDVCSNNNIVALNGSVVISSGGIWTTSGTGAFIDSVSLNTSYLSSTSDIANGFVVLTLTTTGNGQCIPVNDNLFVNISSAPVVYAGTDISICTDINEIMLNGSVTNATGGHWSTSGTGIFDNPDALQTMYSPSSSDISTGTVILTLTSTGNGLCLEESDSVILNIYPDVTIEITSTDVSCFGGADGTASANPLSGTSPFIFQWSNGATNQTLLSIPAGNYSLSITDINGCGNEGATTLSQPDALIISGNVTTVGCNGDNNGTIDISASGGVPGYNYLWNNGETTQDLFNLFAGIYTVTITDMNGCTKVFSKEVTEPDALTASVSSFNNVSCNGFDDGFAIVSASGGISPYSFEWSSGSTLNIASNLQAGLYVVTITDINFCSTIINVLITEPSPLSLLLVSQTNVSCNGENDGTAVIAGTGGTMPYQYHWTDGSQTDSTINLSPGEYSVTVNDTNNCTATIVIIISEPDPLIVNINYVTNVSCYSGNNGTAVVSGQGGTIPYSFVWSTGGTTNIETNLHAGVFQVTVTDAMNCTDISYVPITEPPELTASLTPTYTTCYGENDGSAVIIASGGTTPYSYIWSNGGNQNFQTNLSAGFYSVTVSDINGCSTTVSTTISEPYEIIIEIFSTDVDCYNGSNGTAFATVTGGTPNYFYSWSNGAHTTNIAYLEAGAYMLTLSDNNNCTAIATFIINEPAPLQISYNITDASCDDINNGSIDISMSGGTSPYSFTWSNGFTTEDITSLLQGLYKITITDNNGCTLAKTLIVNITYQSAIQGVVTDDGVALAENTTLVELYSATVSAGLRYVLVANMLNDTNGEYHFNNLPPDSAYYLRATVVNDSTYPGLITTYYDSTYSYQETSPIAVNCDEQHIIIIEMIKVAPLFPVGGGYISGIVTYNDMPGIKAEGDPVPGVEIYIEQEPSEEPVANTSTDSSGFYEFRHIPGGYTYSLYVDIPGLPLISTHSFTINENDTIFNNLDFQVDTCSGGGIFKVPVSIYELNTMRFFVELYPNPYKESLTIEYRLDKAANVDIEIFEQNGSKAAIISDKNQEPGIYKINFSDKKYGFSSGVYFVKININNNIFIKKIVRGK